MLALSRRYILGGLLPTVGFAFLFGRRAAAAPEEIEGFVVVNGWVLKRSDLDLLR